MSTATNPFARGLFVPIGAAETPAANAAIIKIGNASFDIAPYLGATAAMGQLTQQFMKNPYDARPLAQMQTLAHQVVPAIHATARHPVARQALQPLLNATASMVKHTQQMAAMRWKTAHHLARAPKILIPICLSIAAGATTSGIQIRNPYLGATGGQVGGQYNAPWTITCVRTSNNESGLLSPIRLTDFTLGGHNFVTASLGGLTYSAGGAPATLGWPAATFAETARKIWQSSIQPWNVVGTSGEGTGFGSIMTETGFLQVGVFNGGAGTYVDTYSVYCNATLCGSIFGNAATTQIDMFRHAFAPLAMQGPLALRLAGDAQMQVAGAIAADDNRFSNAQMGPSAWIARIGESTNAINAMLDNPSPDLAMGEPYDYGALPGLDGDARYLG